jgi:NTE family protein
MDSSVTPETLATMELFAGLTDAERAAILELMRWRELLRGEALVRAGEPSDALFIVHHGAFDVLLEAGDPAEAEAGAIARLRAGDVIGEIGFFADTPRTATVVASRDAAVLVLDRPAYARAVAAAPGIAATLLAALARRLGETTARLPPPPRPTEGRTMAFVPAGHEPVPPAFHDRLRAALEEAGVIVVDREGVVMRFGPQPDLRQVHRWLSELEWEGSSVAFLADGELDEGMMGAIRQADTVFLVGRGAAPSGALTPVEAFAADVHPPAARRLVRVHDRRVPVVQGTPAWLRRMEVFLHHHVALEDDDDFRSLVRFATGRAVGFVAGGGGGFGPAHTGIHDAFIAHGARFDAYIGTSVGASLVAAFAMLRTMDEIVANTEDIFVVSRSLKRPTIPRYGLLDHRGINESLARTAGPETLIEDMWRPYFAVATNLSSHRLELIRTGLTWHAMRASVSIPGVLPPFFTGDGMMLVDGGIMDNVPLAPLQQIKSGPNLVVHFGNARERRLSIRNEDIPGRGRLLAALLNPFACGRLPRAPNPATVLMQSMMVHQTSALPLGPADLAVQAPRFPEASFLNFDRHVEVAHAARAWAMERIERMRAEGSERLSAVLGGGSGVAVEEVGVDAAAPIAIEERAG